MDILFFVALVFLSIVAVSFIVERGLALRRFKIIPPAVESALESFRTSADIPLFRGVCAQNPSPCGRLL